VKTFENKKVFFLIAIASISLLIAGLTSELYLGDEVYHYRFAKQMYEAGRRVSYDSLYGTGAPPGYFYATDPLWEGLLAILWKLFGKVSFPIAQIYQTCFYALLLLLIYLVGKEIFGEREGFWSLLLMASMPMAVAFGILFYMDVPATAMTLMALYWVLRKKYLWVGLSVALMYLTKRNTSALIPAMVLVPLYFEKGGFLKKTRNLVFCLVPSLATALWDAWWRFRHIESTKFQIPEIGNIKNLTTLEYVKLRLSKMIWGTKEYLNSSLINPLDLVKYMGIVVLLFLVYYFIKGLFRREKRETSALFLGMIGSYSVFFLFLVGFNSDIRYLFPIVPLLCLLASRAISSLRKKWASILIIAVCVVQFGATLAYIHVQRRMPEEIREGFSYVRAHIPKDALLIYPEYIMVEATERRFVWFSFFYMEQYILMNRYPEYQWWDMSRVFFWNPNVEDLERSLRVNKVDYIVIKKTRVYDDSRVKHLGGYPKSFVQKMPALAFLKLVFNNKGISIWEVQKDVLHLDEKDHKT